MALVTAGFGAFHHAAFDAGALDAQTKELIALAIGVTQRCDGCIASHAEGAAKAGATRQQAAEAVGVAMLMNGGPATIYGPRAYAAFCEFAPEPLNERDSFDAPVTAAPSARIA
jgi:AhpD family alkylhydroperoxidase